jgi:hypothetical protein
MSVLKHRALLIALLVLAIGGAVMLALRMSTRTPEGVHAAGNVAATAEPKTRVDVDLGAATMREASTREPASGATEPNSAASPKVLGHGTVDGFALDADGEPEFRATISLQDAKNLRSGERRRVRADAFGYFRFDGVPEGTWLAALEVRTPEVLEPMSASAREIEVSTGRTTRVDLIAVGRSVLSGTVKINEPEVLAQAAAGAGITVEVELSKSSTPKVVCARGIAATYAKPPKPRTALEDAQRRGEPEPAGNDPAPAPSGEEFRFSRLDADVYVLRLWLNREQDLVIERTVDLTLGDVQLEPIVLTSQDFWLAKFAREAERDAAARPRR